MIRIDTSFANAIKVGNDYYPLNGYLTASVYLTTGVTITERTLGRIIAKGIPFGDYVDAATGLPLGATQAATITALQTAFNAVGDSGIDVQNLDDVTLTSLVSNQVLAYNSSLGQWVNVDLPADPAVEDNGGTPALASGITQAEMQSVLNVDPAGTDNSTDATVGATASDVLKMDAGQSLGAFDAGSDKLVFWDDSDSKLTYATIGTNLTMTGTTLSASGGGGGGSFNGAGSFFMTGFTTTTTSQYYGFYTYTNTMRFSGNWQHYMIWHVPKAGQIDHVSVHVQGGTQVKVGVWKATSVSLLQITSTPTYEQTIPYTSGNYTEVFSPTGWSFAAGDELAFGYYNVTGNAAFYVTLNVCYSFT